MSGRTPTRWLFPEGKTDERKTTNTGARECVLKRDRPGLSAAADSIAVLVSLRSGRRSRAAATAFEPVCGHPFRSRPHEIRRTAIRELHRVHPW